MGNYWSQEEADQQPQNDELTSVDLIAAAFSAAFDRPVVTKAEYERRKTEPCFATTETLGLDEITSLSYEPARGNYGDVFGESGVKIGVILKTLTGRRIPLTVGNDSYVEEIKYLLEESEGVPVDYNRVVLLYNGKQMRDGKKISYYGVSDNSVIDFTPTLKASAPNVPMILDDQQVLDPKYDWDFSKETDEGEYYRGEHRYYRPYGWKRFALKVLGKYEDDKWLGIRGKNVGTTTDSVDGEWPVSYHGTADVNAKSIASNGYDLSKGNRNKYGKGVYSTPNIEVAEGYATKFKHGNKTYKVVFQNRVCWDNLKVVAPHVTGDTGEYWVQPDDKKIRPYGLCIKEC